jgi:hypothetical protein
LAVKTAYVYKKQLRNREDQQGKEYKNEVTTKGGTKPLIPAQGVQEKTVKE